MSEPVETTLEEASRCPRCENPGRYDGEKLSRSIRGAKIKTFTCENKRCRWYDTPWTVQVNSDGTIPPALLNRPKQFAALPDDKGRTVENLEAQLAAEQGRGTELRGRF
jgi:hypothetical protein